MVRCILDSSPNGCVEDALSVSEAYGGDPSPLHIYYIRALILLTRGQVSVYILCFSTVAVPVSHQVAQTPLKDLKNCMHVLLLRMFVDSLILLFCAIVLLP